MYGEFEAVIGLEIHAQLLTKSKLFSSASANFGAADNENVTPVCAGMPGTLPVLNRRAVELAIKTGIALHCRIESYSVFARKQYFYPDLPKGYQISQFEKPICSEGYVEFYLDEEKQKVRLERAHMEEDAGKSTHHGEYSLINLNRAGVPLLEIVSKPEIFSPRQAAAYARAVRQILLYAEVCDGNLEEGSMRCDCNVSIRKKGDQKLGTKVELKNINSFRFIEKALEYEIHRQIDCFQHGEEIFQETRLYDSSKNKTFSMRSKEEANDYRYFPDPDLLPLRLDEGWVESIRKQMPEMPMAKFDRFVEDKGLNRGEAEIIAGDIDLARYFENLLSRFSDAKLAANWVTGNLLAKINDSKVPLKEAPVSPTSLAELLGLIADKTISGKIAKQVFDHMWESGKGAKDLVEELGLKQITDDGAILKIVEKVLQDNSDKVAEYKSGKEKLYGFFVGQIMKATKGQANPDVVNELLKKELKK